MLGKNDAPVAPPYAKAFLAAAQTLSSPPLPDRETFQGFALFSAAPLEFSGPFQTVRMGALELANWDAPLHSRRTDPNCKRADRGRAARNALTVYG